MDRDQMTIAEVRAAIDEITAGIRAVGFPTANVSVDISTPGRFYDDRCFSGCVDPGASGKYQHYFGKTIEEVFAGMRGYAAEIRTKLDDLNGTLGLPLSTDSVDREDAA